jgi:DNA repair exonuclease SbcCD ATPase subunit
MKIPELVKPFLPWVSGAVVVVSVYSFYYWHTKRDAQMEIVSQQKEEEIHALQEIAQKEKDKAEASDLKAAALAKTTEEAKQIALLEHDKSEALKRKLAALQAGKPLPLPGGDPNLDDSSLKDEIIAQQDTEIQSLNGVIQNQDKEIKGLMLSRDSWKQVAELNDKSLKLSEERVRAEEIAKSAIQRQGWLREGRGAAWGGALVFVAHALGAF